MHCFFLLFYRVRLLETYTYTHILKSQALPAGIILTASLLMNSAKKASKPNGSGGISKGNGTKLPLKGNGNGTNGSSGTSLQQSKGRCDCLVNFEMTL